MEQSIEDKNAQFARAARDRNNIAATLSERGATYGDFTDHAQLTDDLQSRCEQSPNWRKLPAWQRWGLRMVLDKIARMLTGDPAYIDNAHDMVGYSKLIEDRLIAQDREANGPELPFGGDA